MPSVAEAPLAPKPNPTTIENRAKNVPPRMKAAVFTAYGPPEVIEIQEVQTPVPKNDEVLIKVHAAALNALDWRILRGGSFVFRLMFGLRKQKVGPAHDVAGEVVATGPRTTRFKPGDPVFGVCKGGAAEYTCTAETKLARIPDGMTFAQAASIPVAGLTALQGLRDQGVCGSTKVLINGAAGGVGTFSVQIAKWLGADVTAVCGPKNVEMVRALGADRVIDYTQEDVTKLADRFDVVLENVGNLPLRAVKRLLKRDGKAIMAGAPKKPWPVVGHLLETILLNACYLSTSGRRVFQILVAKIRPDDLALLAGLVETRKITAVIDTTYPLEQLVEAMRYLETGHARGKLIITVGEN